MCGGLKRRASHKDRARISIGVSRWHGRVYQLLLAPPCVCPIRGLFVLDCGGDGGCVYQSEFG